MSLGIMTLSKTTFIIMPINIIKSRRMSHSMTTLRMTIKMLSINEN